MKAESEEMAGGNSMIDERKSDQQEWAHSVVDTYSGSLTRYAANITRGIESARDVVQETFLRFFREDRSKIADHCAPWLFRVCRNRAIDLLRKNGRMTPLEDSLLDTRAAADPQPSIAAERKEASSVILNILESLPHNQQEVVRLKFQNGLSYKEIAEVTEFSVSNVGFLIHTALKNLRQKVRSETDLLPEIEGGPQT